MQLFSRINNACNEGRPKKREFAAGYHGLQLQVSRAPTRALLNFYYLAIVLQITLVVAMHALACCVRIRASRRRTHVHGSKRADGNCLFTYGMLPVGVRHVLSGATVPRLF